MDPANINYLFRAILNDDGADYRLSGKYLDDGQNYTTLEDHDGLLAKLQSGPMSDIHRRLLNSLANTSYLRIVNYKDWVEGKHPELIPENEDIHSDAPPEPRVNEGRTARFDYHDADGTVSPLFVRSNIVLMGDKLLDDDAIQKLHEALNSGESTLRYAPEELEMQKMEKIAKAADPNLHAALGQIRQAVKSGNLHPNALKAISNEVFKDTMIPSIGNKKAYHDMLSRPRQGVHIIGDSNRFKQVNDTFGHKIGDEAIKAYGNAWREALDESVGRKHGKAFRIGGDEFAAHVPSHEHAAKFARVLRSKLEALHPVGGTHKYSMSLGFGHTPEHADKALYQAKTQKPAEGQDIEHLYAHSLVPGSEGAVPVVAPEVGLVSP